MAATVDRPWLGTIPSLPEDVGIHDRKGSALQRPSAPLGSRASASRHSALLRLRERRASRQHDEDIEDFSPSSKRRSASEVDPSRAKSCFEESFSSLSPVRPSLVPRPPPEPRNPVAARPLSRSLQQQQTPVFSSSEVGDSLRPTRPPSSTQGRSVIAALKQVRLDEARRRQRVAEVQAIGERRNQLEEEKTQEIKSQSSQSSPRTADAPGVSSSSPAATTQEVEQRSPARLALQHRAELRRASRTPEPAVSTQPEHSEQEPGKQASQQSSSDEYPERHVAFCEETMRPTPICRSNSSEHDLQDGTLSMASTASTFRPARSATSTPYGTDDGSDDMLSPGSRDAPSPGPLFRSLGSNSPDQRESLASMCLTDAVEENQQRQTPDSKCEAIVTDSVSESAKSTQASGGGGDFSEQEEAALAVLRRRQAARHVARGQAMVENSPNVSLGCEVSKSTSPEPCSSVDLTIVRPEQEDAALEDEDASDSPPSRPVTRRGSRGENVSEHAVGSPPDAFDRPQDTENGCMVSFAEDFFGCELAQAWANCEAGGDSHRNRIGLPLSELSDYSMPPCDAAEALGVSDEGRLERWSNSSSDSWNCFFDQPGELELCDQRLPSRDLYVILEEVEMEGRSSLSELSCPYYSAEGTSSLSDLSSPYYCPDLVRRVCTRELSGAIEAVAPGTLVCDLLAQGETSLPQMAYERPPDDNYFFMGHPAMEIPLTADDATSTNPDSRAKERELLAKYDIAMDEDIEWSAALNIQAAYRRYCEGKKAPCDLCEEVVAPERPASSEEVRRAAVINTAKSLVALRAQVQRETEWTAALRVQTCWRGHSVRRRFIAERILTPSSGGRKAIDGNTSSRVSCEIEIVEYEQACLKTNMASRSGNEQHQPTNRRVRRQSDTVKCTPPSGRPPSRPSSVGRRPMVSELLQKEDASREKLPKLLAAGSATSSRTPAVACKIASASRIPEVPAKMKSLQMPLLAVATSTDSTGQVSSIAPSSCVVSPRLTASPRRPWG